MATPAQSETKYYQLELNEAGKKAPESHSRKKAIKDLIPFPQT